MAEREALSRENEIRGALVWGVAGLLAAVGVLVALLIPAQSCGTLVEGWGATSRIVTRCSSVSLVSLVSGARSGVDFRWIPRALTAAGGLVAAAGWLLFWIRR